MELEKKLRVAERQLQKAEGLAAKEAAQAASNNRPSSRERPAALAPPLKPPKSPQIKSAAVQALSSAMVRTQALAELNAGSLQASASSHGIVAPRPAGGIKQPGGATSTAGRLAGKFFDSFGGKAPFQQQQQQGAKSAGRMAGGAPLPPMPSVQAAPKRGSSALPMARQPSSAASAAAPNALQARRAQSAGADLGGTGTIASILGGLEDLKENMDLRRQSAAAAAKTLGPSAGAANSGSGVRGGVSLKWHGTRSFLDRARGNV